MANTYKFIAYLCVNNKVVGMRIQVFGDIGGHSIFDVSRKLLDKYGVAYNVADKISERLELGDNDDDIPELFENMRGFNKWLLYSSEKFGISESFTCDKISDCSMCPLASKAGYCTGEYGMGICASVLALKTVCIRNLVGYVDKHKSMLSADTARRKAAVNFITEILESEEYKNINLVVESEETEEVNHVDEVKIADEVKEVGINAKVEKYVEDTKVEVANYVDEVKTADEVKEVKSEKIKKSKSSKVHQDVFEKPLSYIKQLRVEITELNSKLLMVSALNKRLCLFSDDYIENAQEKKLKRILQSKQNELDLLIGSR